MTYEFCQIWKASLSAVLSVSVAGNVQCPIKWQTANCEMELLQTEVVVKQAEVLWRTVQRESEEKQKKTDAR